MLKQFTIQVCDFNRSDKGPLERGITTPDGKIMDANGKIVLHIHDSWIRPEEGCIKVQLGIVND